MSRTDLQHRDYVAAIQLLLFMTPGQHDVAGVNAVFDDVSREKRTGQTLIALAEIAHIRDPLLRTEQGREALRTLIARFTDQQIEQEDNKGE